MSILSVKNLTKQYSRHQGVFGLNLEVEAGDRILLLGPNGAGKTTAFRSILGLVARDSGEVVIDGLSLDQSPTAAIARVGAMISKPAFYPYMTGYQNLMLLAKAYQDVDATDVKEALAAVALEPYGHQRVSTYSTGMLQRLDMAKAIFHRPGLLLLDEPFNGVDIEVKHAIKTLLLQLQGKRPTAILLSSHMAGDLQDFANKVIILYQGQMLYCGAMKEILSRESSLEAHYLTVIQQFKEQEAVYASA